MTNHYDILGVPKEADATEIKKAYRKLSLQYHPDRNPDPEATEKYKAINEAHEILSDPQKREQYNMELQFGSMPNGMQQPGEMNDIFNMMFGGFPGGGFPGGGFPGGGFPGGGFPGGGFPGGPNIVSSIVVDFQVEVLNNFFNKWVNHHQYQNKSQLH